MSTLQVKVCVIDDIKYHPNADRLELAVIGGWQCVVRKGEYQPGDKVVYFPPDTILPQAWIEMFGVENYTNNGRIRQARLRGEPSFGLVVRADEAWEIGQNMADYYGATKYKPPVKAMAGDAEESHPLFVQYTEVENLRNFPDVFAPGEEVVLVEKIHGTNVRIGIIDGQRMAGSRKLRRKEPERYDESRYWFPFTLPSVKRFLEEHKDKNPILFGEIYGKKIQFLDYGQEKPAFTAFDIMLNGVYLGHREFMTLTGFYDIPIAPVIATIPYSLEMVKLNAEGKTLLGAGHIREGVVIRPVNVERTDPRVGRVILKYISDEYLMGTDTEETTDL